MRDFREKIMGRLANNLFQWSYLYAQARKGVIPDWYVQDERYFKEFTEEIKSALNDGIGCIDRTAIHVRRGDYVDNPFYTDLFATGYYARAMRELPGPYLIFSDDVSWCKGKSIFNDCEFSEGLTEEEDLNRMASCTNHIIANSSFSWWGAWLSPHGGRVIAPKSWYTDGIDRTGIPAHWMRL